MNTLQDLRATLDAHAGAVHDDPVSARVAAVRGRARRVRRQRAGAIVAGARRRRVAVVSADVVRPPTACWPGVARRAYLARLHLPLRREGVESATGTVRRSACRGPTGRDWSPGPPTPGRWSSTRPRPDEVGRDRVRRLHVRDGAGADAVGPRPRRGRRARRLRAHRRPAAGHRAGRHLPQERGRQRAARRGGRQPGRRHRADLPVRPCPRATCALAEFCAGVPEGLWVNVSINGDGASAGSGCDEDLFDPAVGSAITLDEGDAGAPGETVASGSGCPAGARGTRRSTRRRVPGWRAYAVGEPAAQVAGWDMRPSWSTRGTVWQFVETVTSTRARTCSAHRNEADRELLVIDCVSASRPARRASSPPRTAADRADRARGAGLTELLSRGQPPWGSTRGAPARPAPSSGSRLRAARLIRGDPDDPVRTPCRLVDLPDQAHGDRDKHVTDDLAQREIADEQEFVDRVHLQLRRSAKAAAGAGPRGSRPRPARPRGRPGRARRHGLPGGASGSPSSTPPTRGWSSGGSTSARARPEPRYIGRIGLRDEQPRLAADRLARAGGRGVLPGHRRRAAGRRTPSGAALHRRHGPRGRGRAARRQRRDRPADRRRGRADGAAVPGPRPVDALDRRDHPGRAGQGDPRARQGRGRDLRRPRHRQDRGRAAPGGVPALHRPAPLRERRRAGRRPQRGLHALHRAGAALPRRDRGGAALARRGRRRRPRHPPRRARRSPTSRARRGWPS